MKSVSKYYGLVAVVLFLYGTNLCYFFISSEILARVIGLGFYYLLPIPIWVWALFQKQNPLLGLGNWFEKSFEKKNVDFWTKVAIFCLGLIWAYTASLAYLLDIIELRESGPREVVAEVLSTHAGTGAIANHLTLDSDIRYLSASHFPSGTFKIGGTYKLLYLHNTEEVIDAELISTDSTD